MRRDKWRPARSIVFWPARLLLLLLLLRWTHTWLLLLLRGVVAGRIRRGSHLRRVRGCRRVAHGVLRRVGRLILLLVRWLVGRVGLVLVALKLQFALLLRQRQGGLLSRLWLLLLMLLLLLQRGQQRMSGRRR